MTGINGFDWGSLAFYGLALAAVISALLVLVMKNIVHAVLWLAVCFISLAGIFLTLNADFLALVQVLIYAGAVCIMMVFAVMLIRRSSMGETNQFNNRFWIPGMVAVLVTLMAGYLSFSIRFNAIPQPVPEDTVGHIADLLLSKYVVPFEVAALLLLVALIGAIFLAREVKADAGTDC